MLIMANVISKLAAPDLQESVFKNPNQSHEDLENIKYST